MIRHKRVLLSILSVFWFYLLPVCEAEEGLYDCRYPLYSIEDVLLKEGLQINLRGKPQQVKEFYLLISRVPFQASKKAPGAASNSPKKIALVPHINHYRIYTVPYSNRGAWLVPKVDLIQSVFWCSAVEVNEGTEETAIGEWEKIFWAKARPIEQLVANIKYMAAGNSARKAWEYPRYGRTLIDAARAKADSGILTSMQEIEERVRKVDALLGRQ